MPNKRRPYPWPFRSPHQLTYLLAETGSHNTAESQRALRKALLFWVQAAMMSNTQTQATEPKTLNKGSRWDISGWIKGRGVMGDLENESCAAPSLQAHAPGSDQTKRDKAIHKLQ